MIHFKNRTEAAQKLIPYLHKYRDEACVLLAVPRGGIPIAYPIAQAYHIPIELLMTKKIGHPAHEEFAIGAVSLEDHIVDDQFEMPPLYINNEVKRIRESLKERYKKFTTNHTPVDIQNKIVIIVDDGIATGNTILSSIRMLRQKKPKKIVVAVPVAPRDSAEKIKKHVDDFICLYMPDPFVGVGLHYVDFTQVSDEEVFQLLKKANYFEDVSG